MQRETISFPPTVTITEITEQYERDKVRICAVSRSGGSWAL